MPEDRLILAQETEYTGAGKHLQAQLSFARENGIEVFLGDPEKEVPGKNLILPSHPSLIKTTDVDLDHIRKSLIKTALASHSGAPTEKDIQFLAEETRKDGGFVRKTIAEL
jgi:hypothetical protein